jgi:hypothetical protein
LTETEKREGVVRLCFALKAEGEEDKIILGAFSMIDYYFYFDRKAKKIKIFEENCYLRTSYLMRKKKLRKERILEAIEILSDGKVK